MVNIQIAILSHISDAQYLAKDYKTEEANLHLNFVKMLVLKYADTDASVSEDELNALWETLKNRTEDK